MKTIRYISFLTVIFLLVTCNESKNQVSLTPFEEAIIDVLNTELQKGISEIEKNKVDGKCQASSFMFFNKVVTVGSLRNAKYNNWTVVDTIGCKVAFPDVYLGDSIDTRKLDSIGIYPGRIFSANKWGFAPNMGKLILFKNPKLLTKGRIKADYLSGGGLDEWVPMRSGCYDSRIVKEKGSWKLYQGVECFDE